MIINLFSQFDPICLSFKINFILWLIILNLDFIILLSSFWFIKTNIEYFFFTYLNLLAKEFIRSIKKNKFIQVYIVMVLFIFIISQNIIRLVPFNLSVTSHISITFSLTLWLIFSINLMIWILNPKKVLTDLLPIGTPLLLIILIIIIETVRDLIRPVTLAVRLSANLLAGHLILSIVRSLIEINLFISRLGYSIYLLLLILEIAVAVIQSYVFCLLVTLYFKR